MPVPEAFPYLSTGIATGNGHRLNTKGVFMSATSPILKGTRRVTLYEMASTLNKSGVTSERIKEIIVLTNEHRCKPPVSDGGIRQLMKAVKRWEAKKNA